MPMMMTDRSKLTVKDEMQMFLMLDRSGSTSGRPIETLNEAITDLLPALRDAAHTKEVTLYLHVLSFNSSVQWLLSTTATEGVNVEDESLRWVDLQASGGTNTAQAIREILPGLSSRYLGAHAFRPIILLVTDGYSDSREETKKAIAALNKAQKSTRIVVGLEGYNSDEAQDFASTGRIQRTDLLGNVIDQQEDAPYIFPVSRATDLTSVIVNAAVSSLLSSKLEGSEDEDPVTVVIPEEETKPEEPTDPTSKWIN